MFDFELYHSMKFSDQEILAIRQSPSGYLFVASFKFVKVIGKEMAYKLPDEDAGMFLKLSPSTRLMATRGGIYQTRPPFTKKYSISNKAVAAAWSPCGKKLMVGTETETELFDLESGETLHYRSFANLRSISYFGNDKWLFVKDDRTIFVPGESGSWEALAPANYAAPVIDGLGRYRAIISNKHCSAVFMCQGNYRQEISIEEDGFIWNVEETEKKKNVIIVQGYNAISVMNQEGRIVAKAIPDDLKISVCACLSLNGRQMFVGTIGGHLRIYNLEQGNVIEGEVVDSGTPMLTTEKICMHDPDLMVFPKTEPPVAPVVVPLPAQPEPEPEPEPVVESPAKKYEPLVSITGRPMRSCRLKTQAVSEKILRSVRK